MAAGAVSLRKSHDIVILSFCYMYSKGSGYIHFREAHKNQGKYISYIGIYLHIHLVLTQILNMLPRIIRYFRCNIFF